MPAYLVILAQLSDRERFAAYAETVPGLVQAHGGRYLLTAGGGRELEGLWGGGDMSVVISEWPSAGHARRFWQSPEYDRARKLREGTGRFQVVLIESPQSISQIEGESP